VDVRWTEAAINGGSRETEANALTTIPTALAGHQPGKGGDACGRAGESRTQNGGIHRLRRLQILK
jgi:hypothetical protein